MRKANRRPHPLSCTRLRRPGCDARHRAPSLARSVFPPHHAAATAGGVAVSGVETQAYRGGPPCLRVGVPSATHDASEERRGHCAHFQPTRAETSGPAPTERIGTDATFWKNAALTDGCNFSTVCHSPPVTSMRGAPRVSSRTCPVQTTSGSQLRVRSKFIRIALCRIGKATAHLHAKGAGEPYRPALGWLRAVPVVLRCLVYRLRRDCTPRRLPDREDRVRMV